MNPDELSMTFDPNTIEHLGVRMYSTLPPVLAELVRNSYDADATKVVVRLNDENADKWIAVEDDGVGMTFEEINSKFLRIGRNRRVDENSQETPGKRKVIGKKGLGKLSFFGIAQEIEVTTRKDGLENVFLMSWDAIKNTTVGDYKPENLVKNRQCDQNCHGTSIVLRKIVRQTDFQPDAIAAGLSKLFIFDSGFNVVVVHNNGEEIPVTNELRLSGLKPEVEWQVPNDITMPTEYAMATSLAGRIIATETPIPPKENMRGIALFSRGTLVNLPEDFSASTSSYFFSYLTGWIEVDFIDDLDEDVIATNRQSLNWGVPEMADLREYLRNLSNWLERDWREKRKAARRTKVSEKTGIDISGWYAKLPGDIRDKVEPIVDALVRDTEQPAELQATVKLMHAIVPEYPRYHWRHLHDEVKAASESDYQNQDYYRAFQEAAKRYIAAVRTKSANTNTSEAGMMGQVFGQDADRVLKVASGFVKRDGNDFQTLTLNNIEEGQKHLSMGVVSGCRNPVSHEEIADLRDSGLFTEKDCLDALSLLSHLFARLDKASGQPPPPGAAATGRNT